MRLPRYYPILDTASLERKGLSLEAAAGALIEGGARILQLRHKAHFSRQLFEEAERVAARCVQAGAILILDDRADLATILNAGVHLGQDDLPPTDARRILGNERVIGYSTHSAKQLRQAQEESADYFALGPIFPTGSKENPDPVVGLDGLRIMRPLTTRPLVAIGGITRQNARSVLDAGADSVAVIGDALCELKGLRSRTEEWIRATD